MTGPALEPPEYAEVALGSGLRQPCTPPRPPGGWIGVVVQAPVRLNEVQGAERQLPVCGFYKLPIATLPQRKAGRLHWRIVGARPHQPVEIGLGDPEDEQGPPRPDPIPHEMNPHPSVGGYFAVDVAPFIEFPPGPATIEFAIEYGGEVSPPVTVEWHPDAPPARRRP